MPILPIKKLSLIYQRAERRIKKQQNLLAAKTKTILQKKQTVISQMKRKDNIPEKQLNEVEIGNLPEKQFRIMIVKMLRISGKEWRQRLKRCKKCLPKT